MCARAAVGYDAAARRFVHAWKERGLRRLATEAAQLVVERVPRPEVDAVVCVETCTQTSTCATISVRTSVRLEATSSSGRLQIQDPQNTVQTARGLHSAAPTEAPFRVVKSSGARKVCGRNGLPCGGRSARIAVGRAPEL